MTPNKYTYFYISVIVVCYNEERNISACLKSLTEQNYPKDSYEIIVVDNGSNDRTVENAKRFTGNIGIDSEKNVAGLRNIGAKRAKGQIIAYIDADCEAENAWLSSINEIQQETPSVVGAECHIPHNESWVSRAWFCKQYSGRREVKSLGTGNMAMPRQLFLDLGGFDESLLTGEDTEFCLRALRMVPIFEDGSLIVLHKGVPKTLMQFVSREVWHGLGALGTFKIDTIDKPFLGTVAFIMSNVGQIVGIFSILLGHGSLLMLISICVLFLLLIISVLRWRSYIRDFTHGFQLFVLFYLYYLARSISLLFLVLGKGKKYYRNESR